MNHRPALPLWPSDRVSDAAAAVAGPAADIEPLGGWLGDFDRLVRTAAPLLVSRDDGVLVVMRGSRRRAVVVTPEGQRTRRSARSVADWLRGPAEAACGSDVDAMLAATDLQDRRVRTALIRARLQAVPLEGVSAVRPGPGSSHASVVRSERLLSRVTVFLIAQLASHGAFIASWAVLGTAAFGDGVDGRSITAWAVLLAASVALRLVAGHLEGVIGLAGGRAVRQRALTGALRLEPDAIRSQGVGQLTGRVLESEVVEDLVVGGGLLALVGIAELVGAVVVLTRGSAPAVLPSLLAAWVVLGITVGWWYGAARRHWTARRLAITDRFVELVIGHRTRLAQCPPSRWHDGEAELLDGYASASRSMDGRLALLLAVVPRGWVLTAVVVLGVTGGSPTGFAVAFGGILLGLEALQRIVLAASQLTDAVVAAAEVSPFVRAAALPIGEPLVGGGSGAVTPPPPAVLSAHGLRFSHVGRAQPVIDDCDLVIDRSARVVLEGASGAGKSTLAAVLAGLRTPERGTLLLAGRPLGDVGEHEWRRRVSLSPQFHENHLLLGSLAFNVLLGRGWPASAADLDEAWTVCQQLGLGPLLDRMPSGLAEMVGDAGWQLSQGERSLVFVARSLLQRSDVVLLDESFGSLDPVTMQAALHTVLERAPALVVIRQ